MFVSALGWTKGLTWLRKDLLDFNLVSVGTDPNSGCLGSVDWHSLSALLTVPLLILVGVIPPSSRRLLVLVGLRQPVMVQQTFFRAGFNLLACADLDHTGHAYLAAVYYKARVDVLCTRIIKKAFTSQSLSALLQFLLPLQATIFFCTLINVFPKPEEMSL